MSGISMTLDGDTEGLAVLRQAAAALDKPRALFEDIGALMVASVQQNFESESAPDGSPWPRSLRAQYEGGKTLTDTALLKNSQTFEAGDDSVAIGTNTIYAAIHQSGGTIRAKTSGGLKFRVGGNGRWVTKQSVTLPARPFLGVGPEDEAEILDTVFAFTAGLFGGRADDAR